MKAGTTSGDRFRSWPEILANAARAAGGLRALGVAEDDSVALMLRNDFATFEVNMAAGHLGCWKSQGIQGNGVGTSFDEAYEAAFQDHLQKVGRIISGEPKQSQSDPGFTDLH